MDLKNPITVIISGILFGGVANSSMTPTRGQNQIIGIGFILIEGGVYQGCVLYLRLNGDLLGVLTNS